MFSLFFLTQFKRLSSPFVGFPQVAKVPTPYIVEAYIRPPRRYQMSDHPVSDLFSPLLSCFPFGIPIDVSFCLPPSKPVIRSTQNYHCCLFELTGNPTLIPPASPSQSFRTELPRETLQSNCFRFHFDRLLSTQELPHP